MNRLCLIVCIAFLVIFEAVGFAQSAQPLADRAQQAFSEGKFAEAEFDFRLLTMREPSNVEDQMYLGHSLFRQGKYTASIKPYEEALELERKGRKLTSDQHRILIDQLAMS